MRLLTAPMRRFEDTLDEARDDASFLKDMQLTPEEARHMFLLPRDLLDDVWAAIMYFGREENFQGIVIVDPAPAVDNYVTKDGVEVIEGDRRRWEDRRVIDRQTTTVNAGERVPGPMICVRLLELVGIPRHHLSLSNETIGNHTSESNDSTHQIAVHSSQIDRMLECCLETTTALSRSCEVGRHSLIGIDFGVAAEGGGAKKLAAQLCEEIWMCVRKTRIVYSSGRSKSGTTGYSHGRQIRIGRIGSIDTGNVEAVGKYLSAVRGSGAERDSGDGSLEDNQKTAWSTKDRRRYDRAVVVFNSALAAYAKLSSSTSGLRHEVRRDMVQNAERLLLEVAGRKSTANVLEPSPSTILQYVQPDVVSFNTTMMAWSEFSQKARTRTKREGSKDQIELGTLTAERTESILKLMQEMWDEERSERTTVQCVRAAWEGRAMEHGNNDEWFERNAPPPRFMAIAPNTSSYNSVLKAWSRSPDPNASLRALRVYRDMISRCNAACLARNSLMLEYPKWTNDDGVNAFPDSRTFVLLLQSLQSLSSSIGFGDAFHTVECIIDSMKRWDKQITWSVENNLAPWDSGNAQNNRQVFNIYSYNTLIKTLTKLANSWEESLKCCLRIDNIIEGMDTRPSSLVRANAVTAWLHCAAHAGDDKQRLRLCAEKSGLHLGLLIDSMNPTSGNNLHERLLIQAVSDVISLYGRAAMPSEADELFCRAKSRKACDLGTLSTVIDALCENGVELITHVDKAKQYLLVFEAEKMKWGRLLVSPDMKYTKMYNAVIAGYLNCDTKKRGLAQADALLEHMISSHESNPRHIARPNTTSFAILMAALSQRGDNTLRLEALLKKMEALNHRRKSVHKNSKDAELVANVVPNIVCYNVLLKAYARSSDDGTLQSAMKLLGRMEADPDIKPDSISDSYISALLSRNIDAGVSGTTPSTEAINHVNHGPTYLDMDSHHFDDLNLNGRNQAPTSKSFNSIMNVYATRGTVEGAEKCAALLKKLEEMHRSGETGFKPDIILYNKLINAWSLCEQSNNDESVYPALRAQEILDTICERYDAAGEEKELAPNGTSFSLVIHAWCKCDRPYAPERAEAVFRRKEVYAKQLSYIQIKPSDYTPIISKWKDDPVKGTVRATLLFGEILEKFGDTDEISKPTTATLNALLDVYAKCPNRNSADKAEKMFRSHSDGKGYIMPDVISYRTVIDAWIRSWDKDSPRRVNALVSEMAQLYKREGRDDLRPDINAFNLILKACSHSPAMYDEHDVAELGDDHPIAIANRTFSMLKGPNEYGETATHGTYSFMFNIYRQHMHFEDRRYLAMMRNLWKHCCRDGLVSQFSLDSFRASVLEDDFWQAIGGSDKFARLGKTNAKDVTVKDLPAEWSKSVTPMRRPSANYR